MVLALTYLMINREKILVFFIAALCIYTQDGLAAGACKSYLTESIGGKNEEVSSFILAGEWRDSFRAEIEGAFTLAPKDVQNTDLVWNGPPLPEQYRATSLKYSDSLSAEQRRKQRLRQRRDDLHAISTVLLLSTADFSAPLNTKLSLVRDLAATLIKFFPEEESSPLPTSVKIEGLKKTALEQALALKKLSLQDLKVSSVEEFEEGAAAVQVIVESVRGTLFQAYTLTPKDNEAPAVSVLDNIILEHFIVGVRLNQLEWLRDNADPIVRIIEGWLEVPDDFPAEARQFILNSIQRDAERILTFLSQGGGFL